MEHYRFFCGTGLPYSRKLKVLLLVAVLVLTASGCANLDSQLPEDFPADIPIISGDIYRAGHARFEDGKGFVVSILTSLSYEEVFAFYADVVGPRGDGYVLVETTRGDKPTRYVSIAVHLGGRTEFHRPGTGFVELVEVKQADQ